MLFVDFVDFIDGISIVFGLNPMLLMVDKRHRLAWWWCGYGLEAMVLSCGGGMCVVICEWYILEAIVMVWRRWW